MDDDQNWNLDELNANIKERFGKEHAECAWLSIQSVSQRLEHVAYHQRELTACNEQIESEPKHAVIQRMFAKHDAKLNDLILRFSAHAIAGVQALHAVTDILGSAIYLSLNAERQWKGNLRSAIRSINEPGLSQLVADLQAHADYMYLEAVVNQSKHRNVVRSPFLMPLSSDAPPRFEFEMFDRDNKLYPARDVLLFLVAERTRQHNMVARIGNELNRLVKEAVAEKE